MGDGVEHGKIHDAGDKRNHTFTHYPHVLYVSDHTGDDTDGVGTPEYPFETPAKAIAYGVAQGWTSISIFLDMDATTYPFISIPDGKLVSLTGLGKPLFSPGLITKIEVGQNSTLRVDNLTIELIKEATTVSAPQASVIIEESFVYNFSDFAETGPPTNMEVWGMDVLIEPAAVPRLDGCLKWVGQFLDFTNELMYFPGSDGVNMKGKKIEDVADPVTAQGAATKNYVDTTPSTPTTHGIADNTKHSGALVNDNIVLGDPNGLVKDSGVTISSILGGLIYQGTWNASTNTPTLADGTGTKGHYYRVSVAGSQDLGSGLISFEAEDFVAHNGSIWEKIDHTDQVTSVFTRQGAVVALPSDYDASQIDNDSGVAGAFVDDALDQLDSDIGDQVPKSLFDANTILAANADDTPLALVVAASRILGRKASGNIAAMTEAELRAIIADFAGNGANGLVPNPGSETGKYLEDDGTWSDPPDTNTIRKDMAWSSKLDVDLTVVTGKHRVFPMYAGTPSSITIKSIRAMIPTAPTGSSIILDIHKNGVTIFSTQGNRPTIAISANDSGEVTNMDITTLAKGDYLTLDVDQVGSIIAGQNLVVELEYEVSP